MILASISVFLIALYYFSRKKKPPLLQSVLIALVCGLITFSVNYIYNNHLPFHQKDRITIWLSLEKDPMKLEKMKQTIAYNLNESERAIKSGGF